MLLLRKSRKIIQLIPLSASLSNFQSSKAPRGLNIKTNSSFSPYFVFPLFICFNQVTILVFRIVGKSGALKLNLKTSKFCSERCSENQWCYPLLLWNKPLRSTGIEADSSKEIWYGLPWNLQIVLISFQSIPQKGIQVKFEGKLNHRARSWNLIACKMEPFHILPLVVSFLIL